MKNILFSILLLLGLITTVFSQEKYEKEYRLKREAVPEKAKTFVEALGFTRKIKWYQEEGLQQSSIEAKTKYQGKRHSVEFSILGVIEDIEVEIPWKELNRALQEKICHHFSENYTQFKIDKIQVQYTGKKDNLIKLLRQPQVVLPSLEVRYEIVVMTKTNHQYQQMEFLFASTGEIISQTKILQRNTNHLEY